MEPTIPTEALMRFLRATPEQRAAIDRFLLGATDALMVPAERPAFAFSKAGSNWRVIFEGSEFYIQDTLGARYLEYLLHHPNEPISPYDLEIAVQPAKGQARSKDSIHMKIDPGTVKQYLRELGGLRVERDKAEGAADYGEVDRLDQDIAALEEQLKGGGANTGDAGERARGNVSKAIAAVRRRLAAGGKAENAFGQHLYRFLSTGYQCIYTQEGGTLWR